MADRGPHLVAEQILAEVAENVRMGGGKRLKPANDRGPCRGSHSRGLCDAAPGIPSASRLRIGRNPGGPVAADSAILAGDAVRADIFEYIEISCNQVRRHSSIDGASQVLCCEIWLKLQLEGRPTA